MRQRLKAVAIALLAGPPTETSFAQMNQLPAIGSLKTNETFQAANL
jgi:hypothetical protein